MRVGIITHNVFPGDGQGRVTYEIAKYAKSQGAEVVLIADKVSSDLTDLGIEWIRIRGLDKVTNLLKGIHFAISATLLVKREKLNFDVLLCNGAVYYAKHDINVAHFVHGAWLKSKYYPFRRVTSLYSLYQRCFTSLNAFLERRVFGNARWVVGISGNVSGELASIGIEKTRIVGIGNGVDTTEFSPGPADREALGLPIDVPLALFAGDIRTSRKNLDSVLTALTESPSLHLAVVGSTAGSPFPKRVEELGLQNRVRFLGYRRDLPVIMRASDFFVFPSRYETSGLVVFEAMASGLPVVTARTTGASELVSKESGYVLADPDDTNGIAKVLRLLSEDEKRRRRLGDGALRVAQRNTWQHMTARYWKLFVAVAGSRTNAD
ncbi:glycosyl transferase group 1 [Burkholderia sp. lig30]|jgi:glycosyltransferase involved in cell wall biosynthesis|uniref:glycosyltransferase family 4 protein n=1 Tax=Burkholderia sp. lig30 TaxID=1192124 RepID=UPI000460D183|nr:glycosyltransferase family 4 protein [Burkholderia sp. lig30]KDB09704.1 glycosyl transferase group 1 [Burkholderia sp. lig30]